jgi:hypothetical protein
VSFVVWQALAAACRRFSSPPLTEDQAAALERGNLAAAGVPGLADLGIEPTSLRTVLQKRRG